MDKLPPNPSNLTPSVDPSLNVKKDNSIVHGQKKTGTRVQFSVPYDASISPALEERVIEHSAGIRSLFEKKWDNHQPGYGQRLKALVKACFVRPKNNILPVKVQDIQDSYLNEDSFVKLTKDMAKGLGGKLFETLKSQRNIAGVPVILADGYLKVNHLNSLIKKEAPLFEAFQSFYSCTACMGLSAEIAKLFDQLNADNVSHEQVRPQVTKLLEHLKALKTEYTALESSKLDECIALLEIWNESKSDISKKGFQKFALKLTIVMTSHLKLKKEIIIESLVNYEFEKQKSQGLVFTSESESVIKEKIKERIVQEMNEINAFDLTGTEALDLFNQMTINKRCVNYIEGEMAYSVAIFCQQAIKLVAAGSGFLGLLNVPIMSGIALLCKFCSNLLQVLFQREGLSLKMIEGYKDYDLRMKAENYLNQSRIAQLNQHSIEQSINQQDTFSLESLELMGISKAIVHKKDGIKWVLGSVFSLVGLVGTVSALVFVTANALTMVGLVSGAILVFSLPMGWVMFSLVIGTGLMFGAYCVGRKLYTMRQQSRWEGLLNEAIECGVPKNMGEVNQRSALYNRLFLKGYAKLVEGEGFNSKNFNQVHGYIMRRAFMRSMRYNPSLCVQMIYEGLKNGQQDTQNFMSLFINDQKKSEKLFDQIRSSREDQASFLMKDIQLALGF